MTTMSEDPIQGTQPAPVMPPPAFAAPVGRSQPYVDTSHNWMGIVALITGILGMVVFAFIFGLLGLNAARRGQADNKMMSVGGIAVASMYMLIVVVVLAIANSG